MRSILILIAMFFALSSSAQLGKYGVTVTSSISPAWVCTQSKTYTFCITVSNYNQCPAGVNASRIDGIEIRPVGNWLSSITYVNNPLGWINANTSTDEPASWQGWSYSAALPANQAWNDRGENTVAARTFCVALTTAIGSDLCWLSNCSYGINVYVWGDGDTGGNVASVCSTAGTPDGPYLITNNDCPFTSLPIDLLYFKCEDSWLKWATASEFNVKEFVIETSNDLDIWTAAEKILSKGGSYTTYYSIPNIFDANYYRLCEIDFDGIVTKFSIISNTNKNVENTFYAVYNLFGQLIGMNRKVSELMSGVYILRDLKNEITTKFIKP